MAKTRSDFVTNSSSSSFIIQKCNLTAEQLQLIEDHADVVEEYGCDSGDRWEIRDDVDAIIGFTWMDNFPMCDYLEKIGVPDEVIVWMD